MRIGIPTEIKTLEGRVALVPEAVSELVKQGHSVFVQAGAGNLSGYKDTEFEKAGAQLLAQASEVYGEAEIIVKVKEPQTAELAMLKPEHLLFSYLHLAAEVDLMQSLLAIGLTAIAFETVETSNHHLPLLAPMSDIAGRVAVQVGTHLLHSPQGGKGILLGGLPAAERGNVVILGAGVAGGNAALFAAAIGANVTVFDRNRDKLANMRALGANVSGLYSYHDAMVNAVREADLLIGVILIPGQRATHIVDDQMVKSMQPGSVIIDISVDQGGCIETTKPTTYANPTFVKHDVVHFGVTNMPGAVPRTASKALSASLLPYVSRLATDQWRKDAELCAGVNVEKGKLVHPALLAL